MTKKTIRNGVFLSLLHFLVCILSGAFGWDIQTVIVSLMSFFVMYLFYTRIEHNFFISFCLVIPFFIIYTVASLIVGNPLNYSVWVCGILVSIITFVFLKYNVRPRSIFSIMFFVFLIEYFIIYPNIFAYFTMNPVLAKSELFNSKIVDSNDKEITIEKYKGKVLLFDLWHSACLPCIKQFPEIQSLHDYFKTDTSVKIISLNIPLDKDKSLRPAQFTQAYSFEKLYFLNESEYEKFSNHIVPLILIFDKKLKCRYAGELNTGWNILIGNAKTIIRQLKKEK
jgi:hypothetical protein